MMKEYQVTLLDTEGHYRPVSCIVKVDVAEGQPLTAELKRTILRQGTQKICSKRYWSSSDLKRLGYTRGKVREYDKEKIEAENKERYEKIKAEKFASGEWTPSKKDKRRMMLEEIRKNKEKA